MVRAPGMQGALRVLAVTAVLLNACTSETGEIAPGAAQSADQPVHIDNFSLGTALGSQGGIRAGADEKMFEAGQLIYLAMELKHAPVGTPVQVLWKGPAGDVIGQETKQVRRGQRFMNFAADSGNLPVAENYQVEVVVNGRTLTRLQFDLILASA
jgi:hypothetical protein